MHAAFCSCSDFALVLPIPCLIYYLTVLSPGFPMFWLDFWPQPQLVHLLRMFLSFSLQIFGPAPDYFLHRLTWCSLWIFKFLSVYWTWKYVVIVKICVALCSVFKSGYEKSVWGKASTELAFPWYLLSASYWWLGVSISLKLLDMTTKGLVVGVLQDLKFNVKTRVLSAF